MTVTDTSGHVSTGVLQQFSPKSLSLQADRALTLATNQLVRIQFGDRQPAPLNHRGLVLLANGDRLVARPDKAADDSLTAAWIAFHDWPPLELPLETVRGFVLDLPRNRSARHDLLATLNHIRPGQDLLILTNGDRLEGQFNSLGEASIHLEAAVGEADVSRGRVRAVGMNPELVSIPKRERLRIFVSLVDGSRLTAVDWQLSDRTLRLQTAVAGTLAVPLDAIVTIQVWSENVVPLSELQPAAVRFTPYLSREWPLQRDANVLGGPLMIRGQEFARGFGVQSQSAVTFDLKRQYRTFQATIGIDDSAGGEGNAIFAVEVDGKRIYTSEPQTGRSPATTLPPINLTGAERLTLIVEFGPYGNIGDHADWCDPLLIR